MATHRLSSLCPPLFRATPSAVVAEACVAPRVPRAGFRALPVRRQHTAVSQRYGSANEPPPHLGGGKLVASKNATEKAAPSKQDEATQKKARAKDEPQPEEILEKEKVADQPAIGAEYNKEQVAQDVPQAASVEGPSKEPGKAVEPPASASALSQVGRMEPPTSDSAEEAPPHLQATPYVHHFDTYTLVGALQEGNSFTPEQSISIMKAVRLILADNMGLARDGIVGKGDAEMATYLFRAACNELRTEIKNNRSSITERMRGERTTLQHEVDILAQRITADLGTLKDDNKGMFDDRKMTVRVERRNVENSIQELNYKITTQLNSEVKSEAEGLRWVLVRRAVTAIVAVVLMALGGLSLNSSAQKKAESDAAKKKPGGGNGGGQDQAFDKEMSDSIRTTDITKGLQNGGDPSLVSLG